MIDVARNWKKEADDVSNLAGGGCFIGCMVICILFSIMLGIAVFCAVMGVGNADYGSLR